MHIHLIGVCGTGMGALAGLLKQIGHRVTGSDSAFYPPISEALPRWGVETRQGFDPAHLTPAPDLVVVGNVCRPDNPEARAAAEAGLRCVSLPGALGEMFLGARRSFVVAGTHGKTTTSALLAFLLDRTGRAPGFLVGGVLADFPESFRPGHSGGPFVIEGDEYDSAYFEKTPKFWHYRPEVALIHAIEHDHVDIYPSMERYREAFSRFVSLLPAHGLLVANAADAEVRAVAERAPCRVSYYALEGEDTAGIAPHWLAAPAQPQADHQAFDLFYGGSACGRVLCPMPGAHNLKNALGALAMAAEGAGVAVRELTRALPGFGGVRRRQELRGIAHQVRVYDDFAHHPTAVASTLAALRGRHAGARLLAIFEPRSATSSRRLHQEAYAEAFGAADLTLLAPVGRSGIATGEKLDVQAIVAAIRQRGGAAEAPSSVEAIVERAVEWACPGDVIVAMSNGPFEAIHDKLLVQLALRHGSGQAARER